MAMKYVYVIFDPLLETIVCVHDKPNMTCVNIKSATHTS
jgi:hypothetical protein